MAKSNMDGPGLAMVAAGSIFLWAGIKGNSVLSIVQNLITGKSSGGLPTLSLTSPSASTANVPGGNLDVGPSAGGSNKDIGKQLAARYGWATGTQWDALEKLWTRESSWDNHADNPSSHAYGIPQALPYTKMPKPAWPESAGGQSDPRAQIAWGLSYIHGRYGSPASAWVHETSQGWY